MARGSDYLLAQQCSAQSFDQIEGAAFHLVRPIDREIDLPVFVERRERNIRRGRLRRGALRGGNADEAQALSMTLRQRFDCESCRRAATEPDDHVILNQLRCCLGGELECVPFSAGHGLCRAHNLVMAVVAFARIAAMAAA